MSIISVSFFLTSAGITFVVYRVFSTSCVYKLSALNYLCRHLDQRNNSCKRSGYRGDVQQRCHKSPNEVWLTSKFSRVTCCPRLLFGRGSFHRGAENGKGRTAKRGYSWNVAADGGQQTAGSCTSANGWHHIRLTPTAFYCCFYVIMDVYLTVR